MDKRSSSDMKKYLKQLERMLDDATPWKKKRAPSRLANLRGKVQPGQVAVILDADDPLMPDLYGDAKIIRE